jgi:hypothetical protein
LIDVLFARCCFRLVSHINISVVCITHSTRALTLIHFCILKRNAALESFGGVASQSSTYSSNYPAKKAIDGNLDRNFSIGTFSHTKRERNPWWQVKLDKKYSITEVKVHNRLDCCRDRIVGFILTVYNGGTEVYNSNVSAPNESSTSKKLYNFNIPDVEGDKVKIHIPGSDNKALNMQEVQVLVDF